MSRTRRANVSTAPPHNPVDQAGLQMKDNLNIVPFVSVGNMMRIAIECGVEVSMAETAGSSGAPM